MGKPFGQPMDHRILQAVLVEDGGIEECGQQRVAVHSLHGLVADRPPDRIDRLQGARTGDADAVHG